MKLCELLTNKLAVDPKFRINYTGLKYFPLEFVRMCSIREEILHVIQIGHVTKFLIFIYL